MSTQGIIDGLWRGERKCIDPNAGDVDLWIQVWEELHLLTPKEMLVEVEHVKAHRTKKYKKEMSHFEKFVTEKADELAKGAMMDEGFVAEARAKTMQQEREEVYAAMQCAASFHCLVEDGKTVQKSSHSQKKSGPFVDKKREETRHRTEWCAAVRCMRCGRGSKYMNMQGKSTGRGSWQRIWKHGERDTWEGTIW